jgi:hypothetical protein
VAAFFIGVNVLAYYYETNNNNLLLFLATFLLVFLQTPLGLKFETQKRPPVSPGWAGL